jgi:oxygen-independent coproporphyrinogen-3 oxidase
LIQQVMCRGEIDRARIEERYDIVFDEYFADSLMGLSELAADGLVELLDTHIVATSRGRLLLRMIAMCFDNYLHTKAERPRHSRVV